MSRDPMYLLRLSLLASGLLVTAACGTKTPLILAPAPDKVPRLDRPAPSGTVPQAVPLDHNTAGLPQ